MIHKTTLLKVLICISCVACILPYFIYIGLPIYLTSSFIYFYYTSDNRNTKLKWILIPLGMIVLFVLLILGFVTIINSIGQQH
jgi:hypothetical protein